MSSAIATALLWAAALSSGLIAGVYFSFSGFIMQALRTMDTAQSITAMNAINEKILRSLFMPLFFGSALISVLLIVVAVVSWGEGGSVLTLFAGAIYFVGMFMCTILFNVPLNNMLATIDSDSVEAEPIWFRYQKTWTNWNHLRTVSSLLTFMLCVWVLCFY